MVVFTLTLIRHGETSHNKDNVIQGQMDVPLSQTGMQQAELLGFHLQYQQYSHVYVSDLARAMQTAESIIRQNKSHKASLLHDCRLRERKFGNVEGKSFKFLKEAAEKSNQNSGQYTPPGGETVEQVHERAVSFFHDICEMVKEHSKLEQQNDTAISQMNLNGKQGGQKRKWENGGSATEQNLEFQPRCNSKICVKETKNDEQISDVCTGTESSNAYDDDDDDSSNSENDTLDLSNVTKIADALNESKTSEMPIESRPQNTLDDKGKCCSTVKEDLNWRPNGFESSFSKSEKFGDREQFSVMFTDEDIRSQIMSNCSDMPNIDMPNPNVSLSPLVGQNFVTSSMLCNSLQENALGNFQQERRLSVCSSCDDFDSSPIVANILVVSHGGWLRELFRYFVEDLECSVPGGRKQALRISPNAGLSKFTVSLEDQDGHPKIICLQIHDKQHLVSTSYADKVLNPDEIAL